MGLGKQDEEEFVPAARVQPLVGQVAHGQQFIPVAEPVVDNVPYANSAQGRLPVCRGCRCEFVRPAGVNPGSAHYFRCPRCMETNLMDSAINSCALM
mmetsp:Transcript_69331/g.159054  ORF Transcript_69331/g.159054 Transcript_69331/m.159054 type:complete len:97 (-) Transcript_69331:121-411(-)